MHDRSRVGLPLDLSSCTSPLTLPFLSSEKTRKTRAPLGVRASTSPLFQLWAILRLIPSTYQGNLLPKSPSFTDVGPTVVVCPVMARGMELPDCSPYWARFSCLGGGCLGGVLGACCGFSFSGLPRMGIAFSSLTGPALGTRSAVAAPGFAGPRSVSLG